MRWLALALVLAGACGKKKAEESSGSTSGSGSGSTEATKTETPVGQTGTPGDRLHDRSGRGKDQVRRLDGDNPGADGMTPFHGVDHRAPDLLQISCTLSTGDEETRSAPDRIFPGQRPYLSS